jgi:hypothetical protein
MRGTRGLPEYLIGYHRISFPDGIQATSDIDHPLHAVHVHPQHSHVASVMLRYLAV